MFLILYYDVLAIYNSEINSKNSFINPLIMDFTVLEKKRLRFELSTKLSFMTAHEIAEQSRIITYIVNISSYQ